MLAAQVEAANELGEALTADEIAWVKHCWADSEAKSSCPRDPRVLSGENEVVGKEVNKATQESAEGAMRGPSATETAHDASVHHDRDRVVCARHLMHDWQCSYGELADRKTFMGSHPALSFRFEVGRSVRTAFAGSATVTAHARAARERGHRASTARSAGRAT